MQSVSGWGGERLDCAGSELWPAGEEGPARGGSSTLPGADRAGLVDARAMVVPVDAREARSALELARRVLFEVARALGVHPDRWLEETAQGAARAALGERSEPVWGAALVRALHELGQRAPGRCALLLDGIDEAGADAVQLAQGLIERSQALGVPVLCATAAPQREGAPAPGAAAERAAAAAAAPGPSRTSPQRAAAVAPSEPVRRVLRVLAAAPQGARVDAVAALLGLSPLAVLEALQEACDGGLAIVDAGGGSVALPAQWTARLRAELMPSLAESYAQRLAELEGQCRAVAPPLRPQDPGESAEPERRSAAARPASAAPAGEAQGVLSELSELLAMGLYGEAGAFGERALARLEHEGEPPHSRLRIELLLGTARAHLLGAGLSGSGAPAGGLSLERARALSEAARAALGPEHPAELASEADVLLSEVLYELGTPEALDAALAALRGAAQRYTERGQALRAARLLNDEAAVHARRGELAQARELLERARAVFGQLDPLRDDVRAEQAQTEHGLARLALPEARGAALEPAENAGVGSPRGLQYNREALARLGADLGPAANEACLRLAHEIERTGAALAGPAGA